MVGTWLYDGTVRDDWILYETAGLWQCACSIRVFSMCLSARNRCCVKSILGHVEGMLSP